MSELPIGIFDSGIGGLTVFRQLMKKLPNNDYVYLGDTARLPYGIKSRKTVIEYSIKTIALASVTAINFFPKVNISEDEKKLPWSSNTFKFPLENFKLQSGEILKNAFLFSASAIIFFILATVI